MRKRNTCRFKSGSTLGDLLQSRREELGISLRELARRLEISRSMLSLIERNKVFPSISILKKIATQFGLDANDLRLLDNRLHWDQLRRLVDSNPELSEALRWMISKIRSGKASPESFAKALVSARGRR